MKEILGDLFERPEQFDVTVHGCSIINIGDDWCSRGRNINNCRIAVRRVGNFADPVDQCVISGRGSGGNHYAGTVQGNPGIRGTYE